MHSDRVFPLANAEILSLTTLETWLERPDQLDTTVCVTHDEHLALEEIERTGTTGQRASTLPPASTSSRCSREAARGQWVRREGLDGRPFMMYTDVVYVINAAGR